MFLQFFSIYIQAWFISLSVEPQGPEQPRRHGGGQVQEPGKNEIQHSNMNKSKSVFTSTSTSKSTNTCICRFTS